MPPPPACSDGWDVVVPVKVLTRAKSRLTGLAPPARRRLALAFACDVVSVALACPVVRRVVVVTGDEGAAAALRALGAHVVDEPAGGGLNAALTHADALLRADPPGRAGVAALSADLPALRSDDLAAVLERAESHGRTLVADADDDGTTVLLVTDGSPLDPRYGPGSSGRHRAAGAVPIPASAGVHRDVDTAAHLREVLRWGVGPHTAGVLGSLAPADEL